jgi:hypothetical protein
MPETYRKHYQAGRTHLRRSLTFSPQCLQDLDEIRKRHGILTLSAAVAWAADVAKKHRPENPGKNS